MIPQNPESAGLPDEQLLQTEAPASTETFEKTKLPPAGPLSAAVTAGIDSGATSLDPVAPTSPVLRERDFVPQPRAASGQMNELASLIDSERQDVEGRRNALVCKASNYAVRVILNRPTPESRRRIQQTNQQRDALLKNVLENLPAGQNPSRAFDRALKRNGLCRYKFPPGRNQNDRQLEQRDPRQSGARRYPILRRMNSMRPRWAFACLTTNRRSSKPIA